MAQQLSELAHIRPGSLVGCVVQVGYGSTASPYWVHAAMAAVLGVLPVSLLNMYLLSAHKGLRARWYKKQQKKK